MHQDHVAPGRKLPSFRAVVAIGLLLTAHVAASGAATPLVPASDDEVVEVLPSATVNRPPAAAASRAATSNSAATGRGSRFISGTTGRGIASDDAAASRGADPTAVARQVRTEISHARQTGDTRYWGRAQAQLAPWWDRADAPVELAVLQATVQQGRHEFHAARRVLTAALARAPQHAQGWLTLASLERLQGRYAAALQACAAVGRAGAVWYAQACDAETASLQGRHDLASRMLADLDRASDNDGQRAWLASLQAEHLERAGQDAQAQRAYRRSLALEHDLYTAIALSDLLLRTGQPAQAVEVLRPLPATDAVLLRRASALRRTGDRRWSELRDTLRARVADLRRRGDDPALHGRELALAALWLDDEPARAFELAKSNLALQHEPVDWWVALASARAAGMDSAAQDLRREWQATGLVDRRLDALLARPATALAARGSRP